MKLLYEIEDEKRATLIGSDRTKIELSENEIEEFLFNNPSFLGERLLYIGRQVVTSTGKRIDLLALDQYANVLVLELKRGPAPREIIAQVLDYTAWLSKLSERQIEDIARTHFEKYGEKYSSIIEAFELTFGTKLSNRIGSEIIPVLLADDFSEDIINPISYLYEYGLPVQCIEFDFFEGSGGKRFFLLQDVIGDPDAEQPKSKVVRNEVASEHRGRHRNILFTLSKKIREQYSDWYSNLKYALQHDFKIYQKKDGSWSSIYLDWLVGDEILRLEIGLWPEGDEEREGYCIFIWFRALIDPVNYTLFKESTRCLIDSFGYVDESEKNKSMITKYYENGIDDEDLKKNVFEQIENLKSVIDTLMTKYVP